MPSVLWRSSSGHELCRLDRDPRGFRLGGTALIDATDGPYEIRYSVVTDQQWATRVVGVHVRGAARDDRVAIEADGDGLWSISEGPLDFLEGCLDVDFEFSPSTNTLPINRLALEIGETAEVQAAWVRFPDRQVDRATRRYTRLDRDHYRYDGPRGSYEMRVTESGLIDSYGGLWETVARS